MSDDETHRSDRFFASMALIGLRSSVFGTCAAEIVAIDDHVVQLGRSAAIRTHAVRFADGVDDERFVAVLEIVVAPAASHDAEFSGDENRVTGWRGVVFSRGDGQLAALLIGAGSLLRTDGCLGPHANEGRTTA